MSRWMWGCTEPPENKAAAVFNVKKLHLVAVGRKGTKTSAYSLSITAFLSLHLRHTISLVCVLQPYIQ